MSQRARPVDISATQRWLAAWAGVACAALLSACGGGTDDRTAAALRRAQEAAATPVTLQRLPALHQCLATLSQQLQAAKREQQHHLSLGCLVGTYTGKTAQGDDCFLQVDAAQNRFTFGYGEQRAVIDWAEVALAADGQPMHNLEAADLDVGRPGVQLTRLSAVPEALTETLALRAGLAQAGAKGMPQISYQRAPQGGKPLEVDCRFSA